MQWTPIEILVEIANFLFDHLCNNYWSSHFDGLVTAFFRESVFVSASVFGIL